MFVKTALALLLTAASTWAGASVGAIAGEIGLGAVLATGGAAGLAYLSDAGMDADDEGTIAMAGLGSFLGGAGGSWLGGEWIDGRSRRQGRTAVGALGGAFVGAGIGTALFMAGIQNDEGTSENEGRYMPAGVLMYCLGSPILATVGYNWAKRSSGGRASAVDVTPAIAALPSRERGAPPIIAYGVSVAF